MATADIRRCAECGEPQTVVRKTVPYPESGLDNVQLSNVPVWTCANGHEEIQIPSVIELHELLAHMIIRKPAPLVGAEVKFLRKRLRLTAKEFACRIGLTDVRLSQLENRIVPLPKRGDLLIRLVVAALISTRDGKPFPTDLGHLIEQFESFIKEQLGAHRLKYNEQAPHHHEWEAAA